MVTGENESNTCTGRLQENLQIHSEQVFKVYKVVDLPFPQSQIAEFQPALTTYRHLAVLESQATMILPVQQLLE